MNEEKVGYHETITLLVILLTAKIFLTMPRNMILIGKSAGWLVVALSGIWSILGFYFSNALIKKFPGKTIIEICENLTGKFLGHFLGWLIFLFFLTNTSLVIRQFAESFIVTILPRTPISVLLICLLVVLIYAVILGIESLSRVARFFGSYLLIAFFLTIVFSFNFELNRVLPILGPGPLPLLKHSLLNMGTFAEILFLSLIAPKIRRQKDFFRIGFYSLAIAVLINTIVTFSVTLTFNYVSAAKLAFPIFQMTRLISWGELIQRVEAIFVFLWFFSATIELGCLFYGTVISFSQTSKIANHRPLVFPLAILVFTLSLLPASMTETIRHSEFNLQIYYSLIAFGLPAALWVLSLLVKKNGV